MSSTTQNKRSLPAADTMAAHTAAIDAALVDSARLAANGFARIGAWFAARRAAREAYRELQSLSDRELTDLGIGRADIRAVLNGTFKRPI
ncbi:MAG TPA: DUF1127 domain-containing protein [Acidiphilium sp.]|jgi:uncharacterized protein YjiS (DUF1127 family)|uniref:DUF1127 domain-containing protein n=1 Tax=unclassified Acidiphilium TaxID=2617493 RepID=UPI000BC59331|nr:MULTISPECIES: DUF1127 domain-containing protein [unclassified Acidiphilium]OYV57225.1 MAG: hypothetical protein B7Z76_02820 [Acidiphilium sp. 20-67-58]HQT60637.1 DUF1127 domain-containing protein [Acidiphilium sp.]HQU10418.1 DUF1127 domain-containing protein [Acidiphilium sp.]